GRVSARRDPRPLLRRIYCDQPFHPNDHPHRRARRDDALAPASGLERRSLMFRSELAAEPWRFDLLSVLRRLERENPAKPRIGEARKLEDEFVEISQNPYLEFPDSNLEAAAPDPKGRMRLKAHFLGMFGPQ